MEPTNLNHDDDALERALRQTLDSAPIEDAGFSQRVMASLPERRRAGAPKRQMVIGVGAVIGCVLALGSTARLGAIATAGTEIGASALSACQWLLEPYGAIAAGMVLLSLAIAFLPDISGAQK